MDCFLVNLVHKLLLPTLVNNDLLASFDIIPDSGALGIYLAISKLTILSLQNEKQGPGI